MQKYAFTDRDGTIIEELGRDEKEVAFPPKNIEEVRFLEGAIGGMQQLIANNYKLVLATNQAYLDTERNPHDVYDKVMDYFYGELLKAGIKFDYVMVCPHGLEENCNCRKPKVGGLDEFFQKHQDNIDLENSLMFGDRESDRLFADNLKVRFVKVETNGNFIIPKELVSSNKP